MKGILKLEGMMQFSSVGKNGWGVLEYLGGKIFIDPSECGKFNGTTMLKSVELGVSLTSSAQGTGFRVESVISVVYSK